MEEEIGEMAPMPEYEEDYEEDEAEENEEAEEEEEAEENEEAEEGEEAEENEEAEEGEVADEGEDAEEGEEVGLEEEEGDEEEEGEEEEGDGDEEEEEEDEGGANLFMPQPSQKRVGRIKWPYDIDIDIAEIIMPKIAFGSGEERKFYPADPGHSKLAQVFASGPLKDSPCCFYDPPPLGVHKPISKLGYGIGGLLKPRFEYVQEMEYFFNLDPTEDSLTQLPPPPPPPCKPARQIPVAFGTSFTMPRFGRPPFVKPPGPGAYRPGKCSTACKAVKCQVAFGAQHCIVPTTITICAYGIGEHCSLCRKEQRDDYYRTKRRIKHPRSQVPGKEERVILCRRCYCRAWNGHDRYWNQRKLVFFFEKARHCSYVHEHRNIPNNPIMKTQVKEIKKLTAKESVLAKHFSDHCHPELKNEVHTAVALKK